MAWKASLLSNMGFWLITSSWLNETTETTRKLTSCIIQSASRLGHAILNSFSIMRVLQVRTGICSAVCEGPVRSRWRALTREPSRRSDQRHAPGEMWVAPTLVRLEPSTSLGWHSVRSCLWYCANAHGYACCREEMRFDPKSTCPGQTVYVRNGFIFPTIAQKLSSLPPAWLQLPPAEMMTGWNMMKKNGVHERGDLLKNLHFVKGKRERVMRGPHESAITDSLGTCGTCSWGLPNQHNNRVLTHNDDNENREWSASFD